MEKEVKVTSTIKTGDIGYVSTFLLFGFISAFSLAIKICDIMKISTYLTIAIGLVASIFGLSLFLFLALPFFSTPDHREFQPNFQMLYFKLLFAFFGLITGLGISYPILKNYFETLQIRLLCTVFCGCLSAFALPAFNLLVSKVFTRVFSGKNKDDVVLQLPIQLTYEVALAPFIIVIGIPVILILLVIF
jgi:hypothetical protein